MTTGNVFENIESAHEYVGLLCEALDEAVQTIAAEMDGPAAQAQARHMDALRLTDYKLLTLRTHLVRSQLLLNDLRTLRRYLLDERESPASPRLAPGAASASR